MVIRKVIQRVQSLYSKGIQSRSSRLSNRNVYAKLISVRSKIVTNEQKKNQKINQWTYQTLGCIKLIQVPLNECPCTLQSGCMILRSEQPIPSLMTGADRHLVQSVTGLEGRLVLTETTYEDKKYAKGNKYTSDSPDFFFRAKGKNVYLYITITKKIPAVSMTALFDDPIEAYLFLNSCGDTSFDCLSYLDFEFPMDDDQVDALIELTAVELIDRFTSRKADVSNDNIDDTNGQTQENRR